MLKQTNTVAHEIVQSPNKFMHRVQYCSLQNKKKKIACPPKNFKGQSPKYVNYEIKNQQSCCGYGNQ